MTAIERGTQMMVVPMDKLPAEALVFAIYLSKKLGLCGEVLLSAYVAYAQIVENLLCSDDLYFATDRVREEWVKAQRDYERVEKDGRVVVRERCPATSSWGP